jgi:Rod binding domain-containing protein
MTIAPVLSTGPAAPGPETRGSAAAVRRNAVEFTAVALGEMLAPMFDTVQQDGGDFGGGAGEAAFRPMLIQQMAEGLAKQGGLGLTDTVAQAMLRMQEAKP